MDCLYWAVKKCALSNINKKKGGDSDEKDQDQRNTNREADSDASRIVFWRQANPLQMTMQFNRLSDYAQPIFLFHCPISSFMFFAGELEFAAQFNAFI